MRLWVPLLTSGLVPRWSSILIEAQVYKKACCKFSTVVHPYDKKDLGMGKFLVLFIIIFMEGTHPLPLNRVIEEQQDSLRKYFDATPVLGVWEEALKSNPDGKKLYDVFKIKDLLQCFKEHGFDQSNLQYTEDVSYMKEIIFKYCNPLVNVNNQHQDEGLEKEKRSLSRSNRRTMGSKQGVSAGSQGSATSPLEVLVTFDHIDVIKEFARLFFLFLNTFFSSLSGCIESGDVDLSICLLEAFSNAFSVLTIELGEN